MQRVISEKKINQQIRIANKNNNLDIDIDSCALINLFYIKLHWNEPSISSN